MAFNILFNFPRGMAFEITQAGGHIVSLYYQMQVIEHENISMNFEPAD